MEHYNNVNEDKSKQLINKLNYLVAFFLHDNRL